ncbi:MAG: hypothetical protein PHT07_18145 [Paludibacter sp.]|nr:hypothetical protein [Paludibacter sp.]
MKNLNLNKYGVQEMNAGEMNKTDGGILAALAIIGAAILVGCVVEEITEGPSKCWNDFMKGYNSMR